MRVTVFVVGLAVAMAACGDNRPGNSAPTLADQQLSTPEDTPVSITAQAVDPDGDALTFEFSAPVNGTITQTGGTISYRPTTNFHGDDLIVVTVSDGQAEASASVRIT